MRKLSPLLGLALLCLSCYAPFDLSMSQAAATIGKLRYENTVGPITDLDGDVEEMDIAFLPDKPGADPWISFRDGFLLMRSTTRARLKYVRYVVGTVGTGSYEAYGSWGRDYDNPYPQYDPFVFEPLKFSSGSESTIGIFVDKDPYDPSQRSAEMQKALIPPPAPPNPGIVPAGALDLGSMSGYTGNVLGYSIRPGKGGLLDQASWLVRLDPVLNGPFREVQLDVSSAGLLGRIEVRPFQFLLSQLDGVNRCLYYYDPFPPLPEDRKSYVSWYDTSKGSWQCISWKEVVAPSLEITVLNGITHRIDALLTNGYLFSTEHGTGRLYDSSGTLINTFPLGSLRFVGERYLGSTDVPTMIFSLARLIPGKDSRTLYVDLYTIPTASLAGL